MHPFKKMILSLVLTEDIPSEYTFYTVYRKDDPCGVDYNVYTKNSDGTFYYRDGGVFYTAAAFSWFVYDRYQVGEYIWSLHTLAGTVDYYGGEQNSTCYPNFPTELALRSTLGYLTTEETNICIISLATDCKIGVQTSNQINSGDVVYEIDGVTPFNGGNLYYNLGLSLWTSFEGTRVCFISNTGVIGVHTICSF